jgi:hypothetical protein
VGSCGLDSSGSGHGPVAGCYNTVLNLRIPQKTGKLLSSLVTVSFWRRTQLLISAHVLVVSARLTRVNDKKRSGKFTDRF